MPNWATGNIRFRGAKDSIVSMLQEILAPIGDLHLNAVGILVNKGGKLTHTRFHGEHDFSAVDNDGKPIGCFYISGTRRNFINVETISIWLDDDDDGVQVVCIPGFRAAWAVQPEPYLAISKMYGVDIKIVAYERGCAFIQRVEIAGGRLVSDDTLKYTDKSDWDWNVDFPYLGG